METKLENFIVKRSNIPKNFLTDFFGVNGFNNASVFGIPNRSISNRQIQSYLGRFRFTLFEKYILAASYRYDGSSVFGKENKWGLFPSYSAAWKINEESFLKDSKIVISNDNSITITHASTDSVIEICLIRLT